MGLSCYELASVTHERLPGTRGIASGDGEGSWQATGREAALVRLASGAGPVRGLVAVCVSGAAALVMGASAVLLRPQLGAGPGGEDFSMSAVMLDTLADAASAGAVAMAGAIIYATGGDYWLDPTAALVVSAAVAYQAARLLARTMASLRRREVAA